MKALWKWFRRLLLLCLALGVLGVLLLYVRISWGRSEGVKQLAAVTASLDASDPGWKYESVFDARNQGLAPPDKNSAEIAVAILHRLPKDLQQWTPDVSPVDGILPNELIPDARIQLLRAKLDPHTATIDELRKLKQPLPKSGFRVVLNEPNPISTLIPKHQDIRYTSKYLSYRAMIAIAEGNPDVPVDCCRAILGISNSMGDDPILLGQLIKIALGFEMLNLLERTLGCGEPRIGLDLLQAEMFATIQNRYLAESMKGERASFLRLLDNLDDGTCNLTELEPASPGKDFMAAILDRMMWQYYRGYVPSQKAVFLELCTEIIAATEKPFPQRTEAIRQIRDKLIDLPRNEMILVRSLFPPFDKVDVAEQRVKTLLGTAVVAIACERFRLHNKRWPKDLEEIPKAILPEMPIDLFTGKPLMMKRNSTGFVIYSTGADGIDNGGMKFDNQMPPGSDIGFRLYDPEDRRQPLREMPE